MNTTNIFLYLITFLIVKLSIRTLYYFYYVKLTKIRNSITVNYLINPSIEAILNSYIQTYNLNVQLKTYNNEKILNFHKRKNQPINIHLDIDKNGNNYFYLDKLLGQLWLIKSRKTDRNYLFYRFFSYYYIILANFLFWLNIIFQVIALSLYNSMYHDNIILDLLIKDNIYFILSFLCILIYVSSLVFSYYSKMYYDKNFEKDIDKFLTKIISNNILDYIKVRSYHRSIHFTYHPIWWFNIINNSNTNLGPFVNIW